VIWDVELHRVLIHDGTRFALDTRFASDASRLALYGPSGAGKTQTLKMIAGIARPDRGRVTVAGRTLYDSDAGVSLSPQDRRLAYVFQDYALFPHLTVRQNIAFGLRLGWLNPPRSFSAAAVERWIGAFHLEPVARHYPHQLSGGQRQRTALARALVNDPTALLLDEPFAALDKALRQRLREELRELQEQLRIPLLLITHDDEDLRVLAHDVVQLQGGRVVAAADAGDDADVAGLSWSR
jgi:molybdate transport system ATP-binding protein